MNAALRSSLPPQILALLWRLRHWRYVPPVLGGLNTPRPATPLGKPIRFRDGTTGQLYKLPFFLMYVDPQDQHMGRLIREHSCYERHVEGCLWRLLQPGQVLLDVGANIGYHTLVGAATVGRRGRVFAVEMSPANCTLLRANVRCNGFRHVTVVEAAAAESVQTLRFSLPGQTNNGFLVSERLAQAVADNPAYYGVPVEVAARPVDDVVPAHIKVDVVKIDVEGSELGALRGMKRILTRDRPTILFEYFPSLLRDVGSAEPTALLNYLRGHGYKIKQMLMGKIGDELSDAQVVELAGEALVDLVAVAA